MKGVDSISAYVHPGDSEVAKLLQHSSIQNITSLRAAPFYAFAIIDKIFISPLGRLVSEFHRTLNQIADPQERSQALSGLDYSLRELLNNPGNIHMLRFVSALFRLNKSDGLFFCSLFKTFGALVVNGYDFAQWLQLCSEMTDQAVFRTFVEETYDIIETGDDIALSAKETFGFFLSIWKSRLSSELIKRPSDKRKYLRKRMRLSGYYHRLPTLLGSEIVIRDLSPGGFSFEVLGEHPPKTDELIQVFFVLDDYVERGIHKLAVVKRWDGRIGGAQFHG